MSFAPDSNVVINGNGMSTVKIDRRKKTKKIALLGSICVVIIIVSAFTIYNLLIFTANDFSGSLPVSFSKEQDNDNWIIRISHMGRSFSFEYLNLFSTKANHSIGSNFTPLKSMKSGEFYFGIAFLDLSPIGILNVDDSFVLNKTAYQKGSWFHIQTNATTIGTVGL